MNLKPIDKKLSCPNEDCAFYYLNYMGSPKDTTYIQGCELLNPDIRHCNDLSKEYCASYKKYKGL